MNEIIEKLISDEKRESELLGEKRGREQGIEVGREEGREEGAKNIAKTMIKEGLSAELVIKYTGLSEDVVLALQG